MSSIIRLRSGVISDLHSRLKPGPLARHAKRIPPHDPSGDHAASTAKPFSLTAAEASKFPWTMSKPRGGTPSGISSGDVLIPPERHPACRRREARLGSGMERENLAGDAKGKGTSGSHREAESTDAPERGGPPRSGSYKC